MGKALTVGVVLLFFVAFPRWGSRGCASSKWVMSFLGCSLFSHATILKEKRPLGDEMLANLKSPGAKPRFLYSSRVAYRRIDSSALSPKSASSTAALTRSSMNTALSSESSQRSTSGT